MYCTCGTYIIPPYPDIIKCPCGKQSTVEELSSEIQQDDSSFYNKPGSALESLIPDWAVQFKTGCKCKDMRDKMDKWRTSGCEAREDMIVAHLMAQSDKLIAVFRGIPTPLRRMAAKRLFRKAIELSKIE
jgi:hypothetical protein